MKCFQLRDTAEFTHSSAKQSRKRINIVILGLENLMGSHTCMQFSMLRVGLGAKEWTSDTTSKKIYFFGAKAITSPSHPEQGFLNLLRHCTACSTAQKPPSATRVQEEALGQAPQHLPCPLDLSAAATRVGAKGRLETTLTGSHQYKKARLYHWVLRKLYNPTLDLCFHYFSNSFLDLCFYYFSNSFSVACTVSHLNASALKVLVTVNTDTKKEWVFVS